MLLYGTSNLFKVIILSSRVRLRTLTYHQPKQKPPLLDAGNWITRKVDSPSGPYYPARKMKRKRMLLHYGLRGVRTSGSVGHFLPFQTFHQIGCHEAFKHHRYQEWTLILASSPVDVMDALYLTLSDYFNGCPSHKVSLVSVSHRSVLFYSPLFAFESVRSCWVERFTVAPFFHRDRL